MKKKTNRTDKATEQYIAARAKELDDAFSEMIETIDKYIRVAPLLFLDGDEAQPGEFVFKQEPYRFSQFDGWTERWLCALFPESVENMQKINDGTEDHSIERWLDLEAYRGKLNFVLGFLVGCASMGATRSTMRDKAEGFIIQKLEYERWKCSPEYALREVAARKLNEQAQRAKIKDVVET